MITYKRFLKYEKYYKRILNSYYRKGDYKNFLKTAKFYCSFQFSINQRLVDLELEYMLYNASLNLFKEKKIKPDKGSVVFYDSIGDTKVLSKQYLSYLVERNKPFTYLLINNPKKNRELVEYAKKSSNCKLVLFDNSSIKDAQKIREVIIDCSPEKIILHMKNQDVYGFVAINSIKGTDKYYIDYGDEQFWIGAKLLDYCVEFRNIGYDISSRLRSIEPQKIIWQPFYPIITKNDFEGFDFRKIKEGTVKLFSGGRVVKTYGKNMAFLKMVKHILDRNMNACFIFAGSGNIAPMRKFISDNNLETRWFIIPYRKDLYEVMKRMDIYVSTYPLFGGLMSQIAAVAGLPILELDSHMGLSSADVLAMLDGYDVSCASLQEYYLRAKTFINDVVERKRVGRIMEKSVITGDIFFNNFTDILENTHSSFSFKKDVFDEDKCAREYLFAENGGVHAVPRNMINGYIFRFYPLAWLSNMLKAIYYKITKKNI